MREYLTLTRSAFQSCIVLPVQTQAFVVKPNMIQLLPTFYNMENESAHLHVKEFEELVGTFLESRQNEEITHLKFFRSVYRRRLKLGLTPLSPNLCVPGLIYKQSFSRSSFPCTKR